ncbi:MAG: iron ABC transporter permease [Parvularculaceae bacterium]|nr:iron ABC transporter permease [Parvularculaceae bacterium]
MKLKGRISLYLIAAGVAAIFAACLLGSTPMTAPRVYAALIGDGGAGDEIVIWSIRLPRALAAYLVGAALGVSGAAMQGLLRNPLAEPGILGVSSSASLTATFVVYYGIATASPWAMPISAIIGALIATALIAFTAIHTRSVITLILVGVGVSSFAGAAMSLLMNLAPNPFTLSDMINWTLGTVANRSFEEISLSAPFIVSGSAILLTTRRGLSALSLGEEAASGVGLDLRRQRILTVFGAGLATGGAVALAGAIGFVGIIAPHIVRPFVNFDSGRTLVPSALLGGALLVLADIAVRLAPTENELKLGVVAALIGAPIFIWIAMQRRVIHE